MANRLTIRDLQNILKDAVHAGVPDDSPVTFLCDGGAQTETPYCESMSTSFDLLKKERALVIALS